MSKQINKLTAVAVKNMKKPGWHADGNGLYLQVSPTGSKSWAYRYKVNGKSVWHGLGTFTSLNNLDKARKSAAQCKQLRADGIDPIEHKNSQIVKKQLEKARTLTFQQCAERYIESHKNGWKNKKHISQWTNTLTTYTFPFIGTMPVQDVDIDHILKVLEPIWYTKTETASRVRQRIESILDWATVRKYRKGDNPALWRGRLDKILPNRNKVQKPKHFVAMDYRDIPAYFCKLRAKKTISCRALAFTILTASRNGESRQLTYDELNLNDNIWIIPEERMKAGREHRVPLSGESLKIIKEMQTINQTGLVFEGFRTGRPISEAALLKEVKLHDTELTVHGFRSAFRDWCAEKTNYPREVAEAALAHSLKDKTEAAYQRGDILEKRRELMNAWADYCCMSYEPF